MKPIDLTRRHFFSRASTGIGVAALSSLLQQDLGASESALPGIPHFAPKAKRVIYLFQSGAPSQMELFDYKPKLGNTGPPSCRTPSGKANASQA